MFNKRISGRRACCSALLLSLAMALPVGSAYAQTSPVVWRFAHTSPIPGSAWHKYATEVLPTRLSEATGGALKVEVVSGVVKPADVLGAIRDGQVHGGSLIIPYVAATLPTWGVLGLPGVLPDEAKFPQVVTQVIAPMIAEDSRKRFKAEPVVTGAWTGAYFFSNGPIDTLDKMKAAKYRAHSPELVQLVSAVGGTAVGMPFGELYTALQRNMVDAYTGAVGAVKASKLYEVTKFAENWPAGLGLWTYFIGTDALAKLSTDMRRKVTDELAKINEEAQQASLQEAVDGINGLREQGMTFIEVPALEREKAVAIAKEKVWSKWSASTGEAGAALLKKIEESSM